MPFKQVSRMQTETVCPLTTNVLPPEHRAVKYGAVASKPLCAGYSPPAPWKGIRDPPVGGCHEWLYPAGGYQGWPWDPFLPWGASPQGGPLTVCHFLWRSISVPLKGKCASALMSNTAWMQRRRDSLIYMGPAHANEWTPSHVSAATTCVPAVRAL